MLYTEGLDRCPLGLSPFGQETLESFDATTLQPLLTPQNAGLDRLAKAKPKI